MFPPDKPKAFAEARRVLKPGGKLHFSVWDRIEENPTGLRRRRGARGPCAGDRELVFRTQYELADPGLLRSLVTGAGFTDMRIDHVPLEVSGVSARVIATGQVRGTPRANLIASKGFDLEKVIDTRCGGAGRIGWRGSLPRAVESDLRRGARALGRCAAAGHPPATA